ncbi:MULTISPECIES: DUF3325 domain-containing protein [unclassified Caballeronia]|uniref:DUF3325 domain-containing protein n=1 Tax=unclassified Caballeronia TaxID=2646786 RepID=UPI00285D7CB4|nr:MULTISPECIES: DUF3325 domain-containing protein [unclassified Caballeronia]MDR5816691.1 DUF3325 domain-containing protein [Caballeronia sp. LZ033]MDR5823359.1 DUF3325 domain-containing protein [Caballeronia sp. LZ043]MDR5881490.1 DUF3325 domain-containing protein [Caballeronia sp. LZ032]
MMHLLTFLFCLIAFACLAASMDRHQQAVWGREWSPRTSRGLRITGWCGLVLALRLIVDQDGWALGLVRYSGLTSLAAGIVFGSLIMWQRRAAS